MHTTPRWLWTTTACCSALCRPVVIVAALLVRWWPRDRHTATRTCVTRRRARARCASLTTSPLFPYTPSDEGSDGVIRVLWVMVRVRVRVRGWVRVSVGLGTSDVSAYHDI